MKFFDYYWQNIIPLIKKQVIFKITVGEMHARIPHE